MAENYQQQNPEWNPNMPPYGPPSSSEAAPPVTVVNHYTIYYGAPYPDNRFVPYGPDWYETQHSNGLNFWRSSQSQAWQPAMAGAPPPSENMYQIPPVNFPQPPPVYLPNPSSFANQPTPPLFTKELPLAGAKEVGTLFTKQYSIKKEPPDAKEADRLQSTKQYDIKRDQCSTVVKESETLSMKQYSIKNEPPDAKEGEILQQYDIKKERCSMLAKENKKIPVKQYSIRKEQPATKENITLLSTDVAMREISNVTDKELPSAFPSRKFPTKSKSIGKRSLHKSLTCIAKVAPRITKETVMTTEAVGKVRVLEALQKSRLEHKSCKLPYLNFHNAYRQLYNEEFNREERIKYFGPNFHKLENIFGKYCGLQVSTLLIEPHLYLICKDKCSHLCNYVEPEEIASKVLDVVAQLHPDKMKVEALDSKLRIDYGIVLEEYNMTWKYFITNYLNGRIEISADEVSLTPEEITSRRLSGYKHMQKKKKGKRQKNLPADRKEDISYKNMSANSGQVPNRWAVPRENINKDFPYCRR